MEFTELADYAVAAGTLTEWIPSVGPQARTPQAAGWREDDRPTSYVHEAHLRASLRSPKRGREQWLGAAFEIDSPLDKPAFGRAVSNWIDRHEAMRSSASIDEVTGRMSRVTAAPGDIDIWQVEQERCEQPNEVFDHLMYLFDEFTSPLIWPAYAFVTLEPLDPSLPVTVFFAADHSIIDGMSTVLVAHEISALYDEQRGGQHAALSEVGSYLDFGSSERSQNAELEHSHEAVTLWRDFIAEGDGQLPAFPLDIGDPRPGDLPQGGMSAWVLDSVRAESFSVACRKTGHSVPAGLLGVLALAGSELGGGSRFRTVTPAHTRDEPRWESALGWFVGLCPISFDIAGADSFGSVVAAASAEVKKSKPIARVPLDRVFTVLGCSALPRFVVSYMDVRFAPAAERWPEWNARALRSRQYRHDVYIWINRTPLGINISARYPNTELATARVHQYVGAFRRLLTEVADTGTTSTPSAHPHRHGPSGHLRRSDHY